MNVDVNARVGADNSVTVDILVRDVKAEVTFAGGEITFTVPTPDGDISFTVPESLAGA